MTLPQYPYAVGDVVKGHDCAGAPFTGKVTKLVGPYNVMLDDTHYTPISLIDTAPTVSAGGGVFD